MEKIYFLGIDPGATGAFAVLDEDGKPVIAEHFKEDLPSIANQFSEIVSKLDGEIVYCVIERVSSMPKQGIVSAFNFGMGFGALQMALSLLKVPYELATPQKWMKYTFDSGSGGKRIKKDKERSLELARRLYPNLDLKFKYNHGIADALHMARYAKKIYNS